MASCVRGFQQQLLREVALRGVLVDPVTWCAAKVEQEVGLVPLDLAYGRVDVGGFDPVEIDVARAEEWMQAQRRGSRPGGATTPILNRSRGSAAKDDGEGDDERERKQEIEDERRAVAQEFEIPRVPDGEAVAEGSRAQLPAGQLEEQVLEVPRAGSGGGRSGTPRSSRTRKAPLDVGRRDLDAVARDEDGQRKCPRVRRGNPRAAVPERRRRSAPSAGAKAGPRR